MELLRSVIYILMCTSYIYWCFRWGKRGYLYVRGEAQYKPWLPADDTLNWKFGLTLLVATITFSLASGVILVNILIQMLWDTKGWFFEQACVLFPIVLICGIYLYIFDQEINNLKPASELSDKGNDE